MSNDIHRLPFGLDDIDRSLLAELARDARVTNSALAAKVGIAPSTCLGRVRALRARGVIHGYHADVDLAAVGSPLQAMIAIKLTVHSRDQIDAFVATASRLSGVLSIFHVAGATDYLLHVAFAGAEELRHFVLSELTAHPAVLHAETSLIFEHTPGRGVL